MKNQLSISVVQEKQKQKVFDASERTVRQKFLTLLFGKKMKVLVVSPTDAVKQITISEN